MSTERPRRAGRIGGQTMVPLAAVALVVWACVPRGQEPPAEPTIGQTRPVATARQPASAPAPRTFLPIVAPPIPARTPPPEPEPTPPPFTVAPIGPTETAFVLQVSDGDTIVVDRGFGAERVRYIGVDTPETVHPSRPVEWMGAEASAANRDFVEGREVILERDVSEVDRYGRLLRYVWVNDGEWWSLVNLELVLEGYAQVVTYPPDVRYLDLYLAAQDEAREAGRGLWGAPP